MIIESIRLINIKSFVDEELRFSRGINVIAGRNGTGKSTVIEAVGLTLFGAWPEKFRDGNAQTGFIRRGEKEGEIRIGVESDGARWTVLCGLGLKKRKDREPTVEYDRILLDDRGQDVASSSGAKAEFQESLRARVLGAARIDDAELFRHIIGTEQGMFDAPFTQPENERRRLFERILGIADFQKFDRQFSTLVKHLQTLAGTAKAQADVLKNVPTELREALNESAERERALRASRSAASLAKEAAANARAIVRALEEQREEIQTTRSAFNLAELALASHEKQVDAARQRFESADEAARSLDAVVPAYRAYLAMEERMVSLRTRADERATAIDALKEHHRVIAVARTQAVEGLKSLKRDLARVLGEVTAAETQREARNAEITALQRRREEASQQAEKTEKEHRYYIALYRFALDLKATTEAIENAGATVAALRNRMRDLEAEADALRADMPAFTGPAFLPGVRAEAEYLFAQVVESAPSTERDNALAALLAQITARRDATDIALQSARNSLQDATTAERGQRVESQKLEGELVSKKEFARTVTNACAAAEADLLGKEEEWAWQTAAFEEKVRSFADVEAMIPLLEAERAQAKPLYERYLALKPLADTLESCAAALRALRGEREVLRNERDALRASLETLQQTFSEEDFLARKAACEAADRREREALVDEKHCETRVDEQAKRIEELTKRNASHDRYEAEAARHDREATFFGSVHKHVVRSLAQSVGSSIVAAVSTYANELYQTIAPEQQAALAWDPDTYGIELRRDQTRIRGRELSGGQLMGASLAIKLALMKWYSRCRVGFLDEPTTHLDALTREHLAGMVGNLNGIAGKGAWFDQLFVISHEESFGGAGRCIELAGDGKTGSRVIASS